MTLRAAAQKLWQRRLIAGGISVLALLFALATYTPQLLARSTTISFLISQVPLESGIDNDEERYFGWVTSEYVAIALRDWGNGNAFLDEWRWRMWLHGYRFERSELASIIQWGVGSNLISAELEHVDEGVLKLLATEAINAFASFDTTTLPQLERAPAIITPIDTIITIEPARPSLRNQLELPLRVLFGALLGPAAVLLVGGRRDLVQSAESIDALQLPLLGAIPDAPVQPPTL